MSYWEIFSNAIKGHFNYVVSEITQPGIVNYFYFLIVVSVFAALLEVLIPWRKGQKLIRKQFWLDAFYMFFNFFIFMIFFMGMAKVAEQLLRQFIGLFGVELTALHIVNVGALPVAVQLILLFIISDFVQWWTHRLLHKVNFLWNFHKVHHSVEQMGFAAHLRYHWMETIVYKTIQYLPIVLLLNIQSSYVFIVFYIQILIGHLNHSNIRLDYGPLKYIFNSPHMHIWHHAKTLPKERRFGVNFGISLSIWDYIFGTAYVPHSGRDIELGFEEVEQYPKTFFGQMIVPFKRTTK
jgi:sterol desaturase/sphingolipid hydroxylase (fatty acid hydroxylase superfamily)